MPLSMPKVARSRAHLRRIEVEGFPREDGLLELDARLTDLKDRDQPLASGVRKVGDPIHDLLVRVTIDKSFSIIAVEACSDWVLIPAPVTRSGRPIEAWSGSICCAASGAPSA